MGFPIRTCAICSEEFELRPDKPGFANRCPACSEAERAAPEKKAGRGSGRDQDDVKNEREMNEARRGAIRDMLYRKES